MHSTCRKRTLCNQAFVLCRLRLPAAAGAIKALQGKRDSLQRRCEGLLKCKGEFQEIARAL
jgi:hypothetical protein